VIQGSENLDDSIKKFIDSEDKKFLGYQSPEQYIQAYDKFYDEILS
jgi:starch synthase